jgi:high-affinity nickel permease
MNITSFISIGISLLVIGFNMAMFVVIKFNDMKHLSNDLSEIKGDVKTLVSNSQKLEIRMATQEEHCKVMHKRGRRSRAINT